MSSFSDDVEAGKRFEFGRNWSGFLRVLTEDRIREAIGSLEDMLNVERLLDRVEPRQVREARRRDSLR